MQHTVKCDKAETVTRFPSICMVLLDGGMFCTSSHEGRQYTQSWLKKCVTCLYTVNVHRQLQIFGKLTRWYAPRCRPIMHFWLFHGKYGCISRRFLGNHIRPILSFFNNEMTFEKIVPPGSPLMCCEHYSILINVMHSCHTDCQPLFDVMFSGEYICLFR